MVLYAFRDGDYMVVDEDVEEGARDLMELNEEGGNSVSRKRGRRKCIFISIFL